MAETVTRTDGSNTRMTLEALINARASMSNVILKNLSMPGSYYDSWDLSGAQLSAINAKGFYFSKSNLTNARLHEVDARKNSFHGAELQHADFTHCVLDETQMTNVKAKGLRLTNCSCQQMNFDHTLSEAAFFGCDFSSSRIHRVDLLSTAFDACTFRKVTFSRCDLSGIKLSRSALRDVEFFECYMQGIDFSVCSDFTNVTFSNSQIDNLTFPSGYKPAGTKPLGSRFLWGALRIGCS